LLVDLEMTIELFTEPGSTRKKSALIHQF